MILYIYIYIYIYRHTHTYSEVITMIKIINILFSLFSHIIPYLFVMST